MSEVIIKPMNNEDFLLLMEMNKEFYPEYSVLSQQDKTSVAQLNKDTGIAEAYYLNNELIGVAGIRERGIGEAWFVTTPDMRANHKLFLLREVKKQLPIYRDVLNIWKLFATSKISTNFLEHLQFDGSQHIYQWIRSK